MLLTLQTLNGQSDDAKKLIGPVHLLVDGWGDAEFYASKGALVLGRRVEDPDLDVAKMVAEGKSPEAEARAYYDNRLAEKVAEHPKVAGWLGHNEIKCTTAEEITWYGRFEAERTRLLHAAGKISIVGNFGTGQPEPELWPFFFAAFVGIPQAWWKLGLHEYGSRHRPQWDTWLIGRFLRLPAIEAHVPIIITETGTDDTKAVYHPDTGALIHPAGFPWTEEFGDDVAGYAAWLIDLDRQYRGYTRIEGVCVFAACTNKSIWPRHNVEGTGVVDYLVAARAEQPIPTPAPAPIPPLEPAPAEPRARGLDVNGKYQHPADMHFQLWADLHGFCFGFYSVLIGTELQPHATELRRLMRAAGYLTAPYIALHEAAKPVEQARKYLSLRQPDDELPDMLDFERDGLTEAMLDAWCTYYDEHGARELLIYTRLGFWLEKVPKSRRERYKRYKILIAGYPFDKPEPQVQPMDARSVALRSTPPKTMAPVPEPWYQPWAHQHTGYGTLPPYPKFLDLQVSFYTKRQLFQIYPPRGATVPITQAELAEIEGHLKAATTIVTKYRLEAPAPAAWWLSKVPPYKLAATGRTIRLYNADGTARTLPPFTRPQEDEWDVWAQRGDLLRVTNWGGNDDWYVRAQDVSPAA